jgi:predicted nucleotidyltransferase
MASSATISNAVIEKVVERLVAFYQPLKVYLFGSAAREEFGEDSDLDFLVVVPDNCPAEIRSSGAIYEKLRGFDVGVDVIPWRQSDFNERAAGAPGSLPATVLREGKLVYAAAPVRS